MGQLLRALTLALPLVCMAAPAACADEGPMVDTSTICARCHSNAPGARALRDGAGRPIAPYDLWRGSMMANSARDPVWRAVMSAEIAAFPGKRDEIESTCLGCHAPLAAAVGLDDHDSGHPGHALECSGRLGELARDGVSCTICHGMDPANLGRPESFSAGFELDRQRRLFGPHESPFPNPMRMQTGFTPTHGAHVLESALCATCHTLETPVLDAHGEETGARFLEQAPYLEWRNSVYNDEGPEPGARAASCQDCHVPKYDADGFPTATAIARNPGGRDFGRVVPRSPFGRHLFVGGNTLVLELLRDHREEPSVQAPVEALQASIDATREQLRGRTARVELSDVRRAGGALCFDVTVTNRTGHKLPTAHPIRRVWLRAVVRDAAGEVLFASGDVDAEGRLVDGHGRVLPDELAGGPVAPHRDVLRADTEVALYRAVMADAAGAPTHTLLAGSAWRLDTRLLPAGWSPEHADAERTRPLGTQDDPDFVAGSDRVHYRLDGIPAGAVQVEVELLHQALSARWLDELRRLRTPEIERLLRLLEDADRAPESLAVASWAGLPGG